MKKFLFFLIVFFFSIFSLFTFTKANDISWDEGGPTGWSVFDGTLTSEDAGTRNGNQLWFASDGSEQSFTYSTTIYVVEGIGSPENPNRVYMVIRRKKGITSGDIVLWQKIFQDLQRFNKDQTGDGEITINDLIKVISLGWRAAGAEPKAPVSPERLIEFLVVDVPGQKFFKTWGALKNELP